MENEDYTTNSPSHSSPSGASSPSNAPPPFSSLYSVPEVEQSRLEAPVTECGASSLPAVVPAPPFEESSPSSSPVASPVVADTKAAFSRENKGESSRKHQEEGEPPPPYTEGYSPLESFTYIMAAVGGPASIITQVQQTGGPPLNTLGGKTCVPSRLNFF